MNSLLGKAETSPPEEWGLTAAEAFLLVRLAGVLRVVLPAAVLLSGAATANFLRLARTALEASHVTEWPEPMAS